MLQLIIQIRIQCKISKGVGSNHCIIIFVHNNGKKMGLPNFALKMSGPVAEKDFHQKIICCPFFAKCYPCPEELNQPLALLCETLISAL